MNDKTLDYYNHGNVRCEVTEKQPLESWKEFFGTGMAKILKIEAGFSQKGDLLWQH